MRIHLCVLLASLLVGSALAEPTTPTQNESWTATQWLQSYYDDVKQNGDLEARRETLEAAAAAEDLTPDLEQKIQAELGFVLDLQGHPIAAVQAFEVAARGPDPDIAQAATAQREAVTAAAVHQAHLEIEDGAFAAASRSLDLAEAAGLDAETVATERAQLDVTWKATDEGARAERALRLPPPEPDLEPPPPGPGQYLDAAMAAVSAGDWDIADAELDAAAAAGADPQTVELYRGYADKGRKQDFDAGKHFRQAARGENKAIAKQAKAELRHTKKPVWADVYGEGFGWARLWPESQVFDDFVGSLRLRGYLHPFVNVDFDPYVFFQVSGDARSRQDGGRLSLNQPLIYADNAAIMGGGLLLRFWERRISVWGQAGAAFPWVKRTGADAVQLDAQAGVAFNFATKDCWPSWGTPAYLTAKFCSEFYGDAVYRNRPYHNVFFTARGRFALHYLVTGPVVWGPLVEVRFGKDAINDYWANLVDAGVAYRWRLMGPFGIDVMVGAHAGSYLGLFRVDDLPDPPGYVDLRLSIAGYAAF